MNSAVDQMLPGVLSRPYRYVKLDWNPEFSMLTVRVGVRPIQCFSLAALSELQQVFNDISANPGLVRHFVMASDVAGVFNFGGDLSLFVLLVRARDLESLRLYARRCIDLVWWWENAANLGVHTTALVQGDTLGGGLEAALLHHTVIFERSAQAGFPEVLFNLFPGMGGWNLTVRKAGYAVANEMVLSGQVYAAEQLQRRGLIEHVAEDGQGEHLLAQIVRTMEPRFRGTMAALQARRIAAPITYESLQVIVDHWAVTAMGLTNRDMRLMERLARAQVRKVGGADEGAVEEIKRMELDTAWGVERTGVSEWATLS
ncbi:MAG: crotonase/enoyl-CoA hydratase family protein [Rhizobacter sp.]|nr:crotonase/enoyl-CoA hydratase family protein [Rhizobacter sp.]